MEEIPEPQPDPVPEPEPVVAVVEPPPVAEPVAPEPEPIVVKRKVKRPVVEAPVKVPEVVVEEFIPPSAPAVTEIEYWWDTPQSGSLNGVHIPNEGEGETDWMPDAEVEQYHW